MTIYYECYERGLNRYFYGNVKVPARSNKNALKQARFMLEADYDEVAVSIYPIDQPE